MDTYSYPLCQSIYGFPSNSDYNHLCLQMRLVARREKLHEGTCTRAKVRHRSFLGAYPSFAVIQLMFINLTLVAHNYQALWLQCSSQRQLQRVVLSQRSKHSCGCNYNLLSTSKENSSLKCGGAPLFRSLARPLGSNWKPGKEREVAVSWCAVGLLRLARITLANEHQLFPRHSRQVSLIHDAFHTRLVIVQPLQK